MKGHCLDEPLGAQVDGDHLAGELTAGVGIPAVGREVHVVDAQASGDGERVLEGHGVRVAEVQAPERFGDDDGVAPVGGEVQVVGVPDGDRSSRPSGARVDRGEAIADVVVDVERLEVIGRRDVLRHGAGREVLDHLHRALADDVDGVAHRVRDVDERRVSAHGAGEHAGAVGRVYPAWDVGPHRAGRCGLAGRPGGTPPRGLRGREVRRSAPDVARTIIRLAATISSSHTPASRRRPRGGGRGLLGMRREWRERLTGRRVTSPDRPARGAVAAGVRGAPDDRGGQDGQGAERRRGPSRSGRRP